MQMSMALTTMQGSLEAFGLLRKPNCNIVMVKAISIRVTVTVVVY